MQRIPQLLSPLPRSLSHEPPGAAVAEEENDQVELEVDVFFYWALKVLSLDRRFQEKREGRFATQSRRSLLWSSFGWGFWALLVHVVVFLVALILIRSVKSESVVGMRKTSNCDETAFTVPLLLEDHPLSHRMIGATCVPASGSTAALCDAAWDWMPQDLIAMQTAGFTYENADKTKSLKDICESAGCKVVPIKDGCQPLFERVGLGSDAAKWGKQQPFAVYPGGGAGNELTGDEACFSHHEKETCLAVGDGSCCNWDWDEMECYSGIGAGTCNNVPAELRELAEFPQNLHTVLASLGYYPDHACSCLFRQVANLNLTTRVSSGLSRMQLGKTRGNLGPPCVLKSVDRGRHCLGRSRRCGASSDSMKAIGMVKAGLEWK